ncbi:MAG: transporter substrate-binding domain-containing protein [Motiliproteus sp.]
MRYPRLSPFTSLEKGRVAGPAATLIHRVCNEMDVTCKLQLLPWRRALRRVRKGEYQGDFLIGWNEKRSEWLHFSPPLITTKYGLFVPTSDPLEYCQPKDIQDHRVAVYGPSNTSRSLEKLSQEVQGLKIIMSPDNKPGFRQLPIHRVDAVYSNRDVGWAMIERLGIKGVRYAGPHRELSYYVGFPKQYVDSRQVKAFSQAYFKLLRSGEIDALLRPYGMKPQREEF